MMRLSPCLVVTIVHFFALSISIKRIALGFSCFHHEDLILYQLLK